MLPKLILSAALPVLAAVCFLLLEKKTAYGKLGLRTRQIITGIVFGAIACLVSHLGMEIQDAVINVRSAAPMAAGLLFGGPAGVIAGLIGGVYRWFSVAWGAPAFTAGACALGTFIAGVIAALAHRFVFENRKLAWLYGFAIGVISEVIHMVLIFLFNIGRVQAIFPIILDGAPPMILLTGASLCCTMLAAICIGKWGKEESGSENPRVSNAFQIGLLACIVAGLLFTVICTSVIQLHLSDEQTDDILTANSDAAVEYIQRHSDEMVRFEQGFITRIYETFLEENADAALENYIAQNDWLTMMEAAFEISIADADGICVESTNPERIGQKLQDDYLSLLGAPVGRDMDPPMIFSPYDAQEECLYAASALQNGGVLLGGYKKGCFTKSVQVTLEEYITSRNTGRTDYLLLADAGGALIGKADAGTEDVRTLKQAGIADAGVVPAGEVFRATVFGVESYCHATPYEGVAGEYTIVSVYPMDQIVKNRSIGIYISVFMQSLVFALIFVITYQVSKRVVINRIERVNSSLARIAEGDLSESVNVRGYREFDSLSDNINATVDTLKRYISEAAARIDKELAFAKEIQDSALPDEFPPYPMRRDFEIYAAMDSARMVGGDFYDHYLLDRNHLVFMVADVSGKSIPGAMFMMRSKTIIKSMMEKGMAVEEAFAEANNYLAEGNRAKMFVTAWMGMVDLRSGMLSFVNAGHTPPLIRRRDGKFEYLTTKPNLILAIRKDLRYTRHELRLNPGDAFFLYTDGVTEAANREGEMFEEARLLAALNENPGEDVEQRCRTIRRKLDEFVGGAEQSDDITMLSVAFRYFAGEERITAGVDPQSAAAVREFTDAYISRNRIPGSAGQDLQIIVDEIYTNIRSYSGAREAEISFAMGADGLTLCFRDDGARYNPLEMPDPDVSLPPRQRRIGGLGIFMVKQLASLIRYEYADGRNVLTVTMKPAKAEA